MKIRYFLVSIIGIVVVTLAIPNKCPAWSDHVLITRQAMAELDRITNTSPVRVEALADFLKANDVTIQKLLMEEETWAKTNMSSYAPCPDALLYRAGGDFNTIVKRFYQAIRINPSVTVGMKVKRLDSDKKMAESKQYVFIPLSPGESVTAIDTLATAADEPDENMDVGLFENNKTEYGKIYGFGQQPFGNPNLSYGSQAPFHMGFYHEAGIINTLAPFITRTYPEYRVHLYQSLSKLAFQTGHDYWGWRFMGWGMHYIQDLSYPYHASMLPGIGTGEMLWMSILDTFGASGKKNDAIQLVSNRHLAMERFQSKILIQALLQHNTGHQVVQALRRNDFRTDYSAFFLRDIVSKTAYDQGDRLDETLSKWMPEKLVSDPTFELDGSEESKNIVSEIEKAKGKEGIQNLTKELAMLLEKTGVFSRTFAVAILTASQP